MSFFWSFFEFIFWVEFETKNPFSKAYFIFQSKTELKKAPKKAPLIFFEKYSISAFAGTKN